MRERSHSNGPPRVFNESMRAVAVLIVVLALRIDAQIVLAVRETAGVARDDEVVRSGVPLARASGIRATAQLAVVNADGRPVPAEFEILARWNAGRADTAAAIQWLLVTFPASVAANGSATYTLVTDGSVTNPAPAAPLRVVQSG